MSHARLLNLTCASASPSDRSWSRSQLLFLLWLVIEDHDNLFVMAEVVHFLGIGVLLYKLTTKRNAGGALVFHVPSLRGLMLL